MDHAIITLNLYAYVVYMYVLCMHTQCSTGCYVSGHCCLRAHGQLYDANFESDALIETE